MVFTDIKISELEKEIPGFVFKLCIYLNAGLVIEKALEEISRESKDGILGKLLVYSLDLAYSSNRSSVSVLSECAGKLKSRMLLMVSIILLESNNLGNSILDKLSAEMKHINTMQISNAKARAKRAESKLSFPLGLILIVLMVICIAPAFITMSN